MILVDKIKTQINVRKVKRCLDNGITNNLEISKKLNLPVCDVADYMIIIRSSFLRKNKEWPY